MEYQPILLQVSLEADLGSEPGYISVRDVHVVPGYCHPLPFRATKGAVLFSLGHIRNNRNTLETAYLFSRIGLLSKGNMSKFVWKTRGRYFLDLWGFAAVGDRTFATGLTILNEVAFSIEICELCKVCW